LYHVHQHVVQTDQSVFFHVQIITTFWLMNFSHNSGEIPLNESSVLSALGSIVDKLSIQSVMSSTSSSDSYFFSIAHPEQILRTSLCAITRLNVPAIWYAFAHRFIIRVIVSAALLVWIVENTKCHVIAASIADSNVSRSRISHTISISGSCLSELRSHCAKVNPISVLICD
jgi:hypothetical protein